MRPCCVGNSSRSPSSSPPTSSGTAAIVVYRAIALGVQAVLGALAFAALVPEIGAPRETPADSAG